VNGAGEEQGDVTPLHKNRRGPFSAHPGQDFWGMIGGQITVRNSCAKVLPGLEQEEVLISFSFFNMLTC